MLLHKESLLTSSSIIYLPILLLILHIRVCTTLLSSFLYPWRTPSPECKRLGTQCKHDTHTLCQYKGIGSKCENVGSGGVSDAEKNEIVDLHNKLRRKVATGNETRGNPGPQPIATNMSKMYWDDDLALAAQRWADQCTNSHDTCRTDPRGYVTQNLLLHEKYPPPHPVNWTHAIMTWYDEVMYFSKDYVKFYWADYRTWHYTRIVWSDTYLVGCGRRDFGDPHYQGQHNQTKIMYVCNYWPAGNLIGYPVYGTNGDVCSCCPHGTHCNGSLCERTTLQRVTTSRPVTTTKASHTSKKPLLPRSFWWVLERYPHLLSKFSFV